MAKHTHEDFYALMQAFRIRQKMGCIINSYNRLDDHTGRDLSLFWGIDRSKRMFVHIPICVTYSDGTSIPTTILVQQVSPNTNKNLFRVSADLGMDSCWDMLVQNDRFAPDLDLLNLAILLAGRPITIYGGIPTEAGQFSIDEPSRYVTLSLYTP